MPYTVNDLSGLSLREFSTKKVRFTNSFAPMVVLPISKKMAAGTVPATFSSLRTCDSGLGFGKSIDFVRVSDLKTMKSVRRKVSIIRNSNPSQDIAELQPASKGSQLLGMNVT